MESFELRRLLRHSEGPKLEFKREFYAIDSDAREMHWNELTKDILALANGNIGYAGQNGYLIIGAEDKVDAHGIRKLYSCESSNINRQQIHNRVNSSCHPPIPDILLERLLIEDKTLFVIAIPPSFFLHETTKDLKTAKTTFHKGTVFVRRGEDIHNATQEERDAIRNEKQRTFESIRVQSQLERRIKASERFIEGRQADLTEQRSLPSSERSFDLEQLRDEIDLEKLTLDYLKAKLRFEQSLLYLNTDNSQRSKRFFDYAMKLLNEKMPKILSDLDVARDLVEEIRDDAKNALDFAIKYGNRQSKIYYMLMQIYDIKGESLSAYELGCEATEVESDFVDLYRLHLKICHLIKELYDDYKEEAEACIQRHKQRLCQILGVEEVDDWGQPL